MLSDYWEPTVCVYSASGEFVYGYNLYKYGDVGIKYSGDDLSIYLNLSDRLPTSATKLILNSAGEVIDCTSYESSEVNLNISQVQDSNSRQYVLKKAPWMFNLFSTSYSKLIFIDSNGTERVICDVSPTFQRQATIIYTFAIPFFAIVALVLIFEYRKQKQST